ncbi:hypothetical protein VTN02DRAFT_5748 [Thermoascus thermophilus]
MSNATRSSMDVQEPCLRHDIRYGTAVYGRHFAGSEAPLRLWLPDAGDSRPPTRSGAECGKTGSAADAARWLAASHIARPGYVFPQRQDPQPARPMYGHRV